MPDRAVVDELCCENPDIQMWYGDDDQQQFYCRNCNSPFPPVQPQPRAVVAISEDRQWLVVLTPDSCKLRHKWVVLKCTWAGDYWLQDHIPDTGQDAHEVLREFLEGRDGTTPDSDYPLRDLPTDRAEADDVHPGAGAGTGQ